MFEKELSLLQQRHLLRQLIVIERQQGPLIRSAEGRNRVLMCSNDYLGLSLHPALREAARLSFERYGFGTGASRLVSGTFTVHRELEERIARFKGTEAAILFNSGYAANTGIIPALAEEGDIVLSDSLNHASIIDGCRLSRARTAVYRHKDMNHLEGLLRDCGTHGRMLIVTDGVFSMDGDIAPLPDLVFLAGKYHALLMVDDAHGTGVLGRKGMGVVEHFGLEDRVPVQMGTLGKAFGTFGAYAAGDRSLIDYLVNRARSFIYSTALPPAVCAASVAAIDVAENEPGLRTMLWKNREHLLSGLRVLGISWGASESPIIPVMIGESEQTLQAAAALDQEGIFAPAVRPPTVPDGQARIRMTVTASHRQEDLDLCLNALKKCKEYGLV